MARNNDSHPGKKEKSELKRSKFIKFDTFLAYIPAESVKRQIRSFWTFFPGNDVILEMVEGTKWLKLRFVVYKYGYKVQVYFYRHLEDSLAGVKMGLLPLPANSVAFCSKLDRAG